MRSHSLKLKKDGAVFISRLIFVTGGARSGKSRFALQLAEEKGYRHRLFVATAVACDPEMRQRIVRHRKERNGPWAALEESTCLPERLPKNRLSSGTVVLVDCLSTFVTNLLLAKKSSSQILRQVRSLLKALKRPGVTAICVSNEVGLGIVPEYPLGREFRDLLGTVNQAAAQAADEVYFLVAGIPTRIK